MSYLKIVCGTDERVISFEGEHLLGELLSESGMYVEHPCGGKGSCKKCTVLLNGEAVLTCQYRISSDATVIIPQKEEMLSVSGAKETGRLTENAVLCLDIGTTTVALALVSPENGEIVKTAVKTNPQRAFGADVISRIEYCRDHGTGELQTAVTAAVNETVQELLKAFGVATVSKMFVSGNTTMLHLFFGVDCSAMGVSPYTPSFLSGQTVKAERLGVASVGEIVSLPNISAFVGADIVAGINLVGKPATGKYSILLDLGTNAEIALFNGEHIYTTTAAAGPCFEGANISCGMSALNGAISKYELDGTYSVIGNTKPKGLCATGLIDLISVLVKKGIVDESGYMDDEEFCIADGVSLMQKDVREFQLAKSAVRSALVCLMKTADVEFEQIDKLYVAGGFSAQMNVENAAFVGLIPSELIGNFSPVNNSSLLGTVKYACENNALDALVESAEYVDISGSALFSEEFFNNMAFG